jgi:hypothetical protein
MRVSSIEAALQILRKHGCEGQLLEVRRPAEALRKEPADDDFVMPISGATSTLMT